MSALAEALAAAQAELPTAIPRDSQGLGYRYTSLDNEPDFICKLCRDTPAAPRYLEEEREPEPELFGEEG